MIYSKYYQAQVEEKNCWFFVGIIRSFEHMAFDRTFDKKNSIFEFFVPELNTPKFLVIMDYFIKKGIVKDLKELPNRLLDPREVI